MDVSVILDNGRSWVEIRDLAQAAEELGVHAVYVCDHFMEDRADGRIDDSPFLECGTLLAGLAVVTTRARLGALVMGSTYRHPAVVANMVTTLDHISGGRAIAGLGAGWQVNEHRAYGIDLLSPGDRSDRFEESVAVVASLLREERTTFEGRFFQLTDAPNKPAPLQERLPVLVAGGGERRTLPTAARYADVWHVWGRPDGFAAKSAKLDEACAAIGRDPAEIRRATGFPTPVGTEMREALAPYREVCDEFVVFDWTDRPVQSTLDDLTAALAGPGVSLPPLAEGVGLPWDVAVEDAVAEIARAREQHGDTFRVRTGRDEYVFTFSPTGVESFYALPEEVASKGLADYLMLRRKLPDEIFDGRRTMPHLLFRKGDVVHYLANLDAALDATVAELGESGTVDLFALTRRLGHRMGLASWAGPGCSEGAAFDRLVAAFDRLDGSDAFVHPDAMAAVAASGKAEERAALAEVTDVLGGTVDDPGPSGLFARIVGSWAGEPDDARRTGIAHDVALIHIASMSNLAAALGWALADLVEHPDVLGAVLAGDTELGERCALETTRLAQRSIMARSVMSPVSFDTGDATYDLQAGTFVATLLPLLNTSAAEGLESWRPERWSRWRLAEPTGLASPQLVTAFGHGRHTCPAQPFSLSAMTRAVTRLLGTYEMTATWSAHPTPVPAQIGGVARAAHPATVAYSRRP